MDILRFVDNDLFNLFCFCFFPWTVSPSVTPVSLNKVLRWVEQEVLTSPVGAIPGKFNLFVLNCSFLCSLLKNNVNEPRFHFYRPRAEPGLPALSHSCLLWPVVQLQYKSLAERKEPSKKQNHNSGLQENTLGNRKFLCKYVRGKKTTQAYCRRGQRLWWHKTWKSLWLWKLHSSHISL